MKRWVLAGGRLRYLFEKIGERKSEVGDAAPFAQVSAGGCIYPRRCLKQCGACRIKADDGVPS